MSMDHIHALPSGTLLEEYRLHSVLGAGGFGITYRAEDTHLNKVVAIKEYLPSEFATRTGTRTVVPHSGTQAQDYHWGLTRFLDEARTLARFDHPHLNKVYRFFEANGTAYLVLEYIEGETLGDLLDRRGTLPEVELHRLLAEVLGGLAVVHEAGYVHRDVKPGNLMLRDEDGSVVLLDFGAARQAVGQRSRSVTSILTPGYAPVEQYGMRVEDVGPWSDIYALGMVAYRCVSGLRDGQLPDAVTRSGDQRKGGGDWASAVAVGRGRYAESLLRAIDWAVAVNEEDRPQGVAQWQAALSGEVDGSAAVQREGAVSAAIPRDSKAERSPRFAVRWALAGVVALTLAFGAYWFVQTRADDEAYARARSAGTVESWEEYLQGYPAGRHADEARNWRQALIAAAEAKAERLAAARELWESVKDSQNPADFEGYLTQYPDGTYAAEARNRRQALIAVAEAKAERLAAARELWESVKDSQNPADFEGYLTQYPDGTHAAEARSRRQALIAAAEAKAERLAAARELWESVKDSQNPTDFEGYLMQYPDGTHAAEARSRQQALITADDGAYARAQSAATVAAYREYLQSYPAGRHAAEAQRLQAEVRLTELRPGQSFRDELGSGGQGPEMVVLPAGRFRMGCVSGRDCDDDETLVHEVRIAQPFAMSKYEVTFAQWDACVADGGCGGYEPDDWGWGRGNRPVIEVSWKDAMGYVQWLSRKTGARYRLPSEAEWEYASRSGSTTKYHFGDDESQLCRYANHADRSTDFSWRNESCSDGVGIGTAEVGSYRPNDFGLYDMHGNVWEWVADCWNVSYAGAPSDGSAWISGDCGSRILRGGSWFSVVPWSLRSANRRINNTSARFFSFGFRVARTLTP